MARHLARVEPIVGKSLQSVKVALSGLPEAMPIVTHLAACGVGRWLLVDPGDDSPKKLQTVLRSQHGSALDLDIAELPEAVWTRVVARQPPDLVIAVGTVNERKRGLAAAVLAGVPALLIASSTAGGACQTISFFPNDDAETVRNMFVPRHRSTSPWDWVTTAPLCAGLARAMLLRETRFRRADLEELWSKGVRALKVGEAGDPLAIRWSGLEEALLCNQLGHQRSSEFHTPATRRGTALIVGLGSLGSVAAYYLAPHRVGMVIADPDRVDVYNPVRQAYPLATVGQPKARALGAGLLAAGVENVVALETALTDEGEVADLVDRHKVAAALVVTGTESDFAVARGLRACGVPHIVGRCYPRARYWEAILVDGQRGPELGDLRGRLSLGPTAPPTPEQTAAYSDAGALEAEPATLIESGWAAAWMARLAAQLLAPAGLRERWVLELLALERTCVIGGVGVEETAEGAAYGIELPGAIRALGRGEIGSSVSANAADLFDLS